MNKELIAAVLPDGGPRLGLQLEWTDTESDLGKTTAILQQEIWQRFHEDPASALLFLCFCDLDVPLSPSLDYWRRFAGLFTEKLIRIPELEILRHDTEVPIPADELRHALESAPLTTGSEYLSMERLEDTWRQLNHIFQRAVKNYSGTIEAFINTYSPDIHLVGRVFFHLVENKKGEAPFAFLATYSTSLNEKGQSRHLPLKHALREYADHNDKLLELLATVHAAARQSALVTDLIETGELFHPLAWSAREAFDFLKEIPLYESSGILCRIPNWWKGGSAGVRMTINIGDTQPAFVGMDALLSFDARLVIGDTKISEAEARELLAASEGLAFIKNKWVAVDPDKLKKTLDAYDKAQDLIENQGLSMRDALRMQLNPERIPGVKDADVDVTVSNGEWMASVIQKMRNPDLPPEVKPGKGFRATLREYQKKGVNWLYLMHCLGLGACLADDMELGKTVQMLCFLSVVQSETPAGRKTAGKAKTGVSKTPSGIQARKAKTAAADRKNPVNRKKTVKKTAKTAPVKPLKNASPGKPPTRKVETATDPSTYESAFALVQDLIQKSRYGIGIPELVEKTGFDRKKIHNLIFRLKMKQKIKSVSRGIFIGTP